METINTEETYPDVRQSYEELTRDEFLTKSFLHQYFDYRDGKLIAKRRFGYRKPGAVMGVVGNSIGSKFIHKSAGNRFKVYLGKVIYCYFKDAFDDKLNMVHIDGDSNNYRIGNLTQVGATEKDICKHREPIKVDKSLVVKKVATEKVVSKEVVTKDTTFTREIYRNSNGVYVVQVVFGSVKQIRGNYITLEDARKGNCTDDNDCSNMTLVELLRV